MRHTSGSKSPTSSHCKMLLILASLACSDLIDLDFRGRVRSTSLKNVLGLGLSLIPSTMISSTSTGGSSSKTCNQTLYLVVQQVMQHLGLSLTVY